MTCRASASHPFADRPGWVIGADDSWGKTRQGHRTVIKPQARRSLHSSLMRTGLHWALALAAAAPVAALAAPVLSVAFDPAPAATYVPGQTRDVTLKFSNTSSTDAASTAALTLASLPGGVTIETNSRSCSATGTGSACGTAASSGAGLYSGASIAANGHLTISATLKFSAAATGNKAITATGSASGAPNATASHSFTRTPVADLNVSVTPVVIASPQGSCPDPDDAGTYTPGCAAAYTVVVENTGPDAADGASLSIERSEASAGTFVWTCTPAGSAVCPAAGGTWPKTISDFPDNGKLTFSVTVNHAVTDTYSGVGITAESTAPAGTVDTNSANDTQTSTARTRNSAANLKTTVTATSSPTAGNCPGNTTTLYTPGCQATYEVEFINNGPDGADGSTLDLNRSEDSAGAFAWTCTASGSAACSAASGTGPLAAVSIPTFPKNGKLTYAVTVSHASSDFYSDAGIEASVAPPASRIDIDDTDNTDNASRAIDRRAALRVVKEALENGSPVTQVSANQAFDYQITVYNDGPSDIGNTATGTIDATGPALVLTDVFDDQLVGINCSLGAANNSPNAANNSPNAAKPPCWTLCPSTLGWSVEGSTVADATHCPVAWVEGTAAQLDQRFALRAGTGSRLQTRVNVPSVTVATTILNTANVSASACPQGASNCEPVALEGAAADRSSQVSVIIVPAAAATIAVTNVGDGSAVPGLAHSYLITVKNDGTQHLPGTVTTSGFPLATGAGVDGFVPGSVYYQCRAYGSAVCFEGGASGQTEPTQPVYADSLSATSNLPQGSRVEFTVTGLLDPRAINPVILLAQVAPNGIAAVSGSVATTMTPAVSLSLSKRLVERSAGDSPTLTYEIIAGNDGPSFASGAELNDGAHTVSSPADFDFGLASWTCVALPAPPPAVAPEQTECLQLSGNGGVGDGSGPGSGLMLDLMPGGRAVVRLQVPVTGSGVNQVENVATLSRQGAGTKQARALTSLRATYALDVTKTDSLEVAHPGTAHTYTITVQNNGPDDAYDVHVQDEMPVELQNVQWTCAAISPVPGDLAPLVDSLGEVKAIEPKGRPGLALTASRDGRHVYVIGRNTHDVPTLYAYYRNATPGLDYGQVGPNAIDVETDGIDDTTDIGSAVAGMENPVDLVLTPDGSVLYVLSQGQGSTPSRIAVFHRGTLAGDPEFGRLSYAGTVDMAMQEARRIVATATHLYVAGSGTAGGIPAQIEVYRPDSSNQLPVPVSGGVTPAPAAAGPMVVDAAAGRLYVASTVNSMVRRYVITPSGASAGLLTQDAATGSSEANYTAINDLVLAPNGRDLYLHASNGGTPRIGWMQSTSDAPYLAFKANYGDHAGNLLAGAVRLGLAPDGEHLMGVSPGQNALFTMRRNTVTGGLTGGDVTHADVEQWLTRDGTAGSTAAIGLDFPTALLVTPDNRHVLVASGSTSDPIGPLTVLSRRAPAPLLGFIEQERNGDDIAGTQNQIDSLTGPDDVVSRGGFVYVLSKEDSSVTLFKRRLSNVGAQDNDGGHLTFVQAWSNGQGTITGMSRPDRLLISPNGESLFVTSVEGDSLAVFRRNNTDGVLTFASSFQATANPGLKGARGMAMNRSGTHLYVAGSYASSIAIFAHDGSAPNRLTYVGQVVSGQGGVTGLNGIRDLVVAGEDTHSQLIGVSDAANSVVVFDRDQANGQLAFVQALNLGANQRPMALAMSPDIGSSDNAHIYVAAQNSNTIYVLQRVLDSTHPQYGRIRLLTSVVAGGDAPTQMTGPRSVAVSPNGKRVYVAAQYGSSLVAFERYDAPSSSLYGQLTFAEVRRQNVDAVDGIAVPYAVAVSDDSRNVYVAGFDSNAVASFSVGTGSTCSAAGSGDIDDTVTIRARGAVIYTITSTIRPDARGTLRNEVTASGEGDSASDVDDDTVLRTSAQLEVTKTNNQVSVTPGEPVTYELTVRNTGPGNATGLDDPQLANVTDLFGCSAAVGGGHDCSNSPFEAGTISWTCAASGSGALDFLAAYRDEEAGISGLAGVSSLALIPKGTVGDGNDVRGNFLVAASVDDDDLVFFRRDAGTGALSFHSRLDAAAGMPLQGARSVAVSQDGRLLFVASRQSDSLIALALSGSPTEALIVTSKDVMKNPLIKGLDQALHVIALPAGNGIEHVYVAGANDHAVAAFAYDRALGTLSHLGSWIEGVGGVQGLSNVEYLVASPDGKQVYALSGSSGNVVQFDRDAATGGLSYVARFGSGALGVSLDGVSSGDFDPSGKYLYLTASAANRLVVLSRVTTVGVGNFGSLALVTSVGQDEQGARGLNNPRRVVVSDDGQHVYVTSQSRATLAWFSLNRDTGVPTYQGIRSNQSSGVEGLAGATGLVIDGQLNQVYVAGNLDRAIVHFQRQSDSWCPPSGTGLLDQVPVNIAAGGQVTFQLTATVSSNLPGNLVNVANATWQSDIAWQPPVGIGCTRNDPSELYSCTYETTDEDVPASLADLSITKDDGLAEFDGLMGAVAVAADVNNVYVAAPGDHGIGMFRRQPSDATGIGLTYLGAMRSGVAGVSGLAGVSDLVASADGRNLYAASPVDNTVTSFVRDAGSGSLGQIDVDQNGLLGVTGLSGARAVAISPDGEHVYVAGEFSNAIAIFRRQTQVGAADEGKLSFVTSIQSGVAGVNGIDAPRALALSADGKNLYVLGSAADTLVAFSRQTNPGSGNFGRLTQIGVYQNASGGVLGMDEVRSLALSADGGHLYVLGAEAGSLVHFARDAADGMLTFVPHLPGTADVLLVPELVGAARIRMAGDGRLYAAATGQNAIGVIELDTQGKPTLVHLVRNGDVSSQPLAGLVDGLKGIADVAWVDDGQAWLYGGGALDDALSEFVLTNGEPGYLGSVFDGMGGVAPGDTVTYVIVVKNHGPSDVLSAHVVDAFPPAFERVDWTCSGYAGGTCTVSGTGNIDMENVSVPADGSIQIEAQGVVRADAAGRRLLAASGNRLINTATVEAVGVLDPDLSNNSATDDNTVMSPSMNLSVTVDDNGCDLSDPGCSEVTEATPGGSINYRVRAANAGPTYARTVRVSDTLPAALYDVSWTCKGVPQAGLLTQVALEESDVDIAYRALAVDTLGTHAYAVGIRSDVNGMRDTVVALTRNPLNGALARLQAYSSGDTEPLPGGGSTPPVRGIDGAVDVVVTADGRHVYVAGHDADAIAIFDRDAATGKLSWRAQLVNGELGVEGIGGISALALSPDGQYLYAGAASGQSIAVFALDPGTGLLAQVSVIRQGQGGVNGLNGVTDLAFDADGEVLFVTARENRSVTAFRRNPSSGALTYVTGIEDGQVGVTASLLSPSAVAVSGDRVMVADAQGDAVSLLRFVDGATPAFELDEVVALDSDGVNGTQAPLALAFVPDQARLYVGAAASGQLHLFSLLDTSAQRIETYDATLSPALSQVAALAVGPEQRQLYAVSSGDGLVATLARERGSRCPLAGENGLGTQVVDIAPGGAVDFDVGGSIFANATGMLTYAAVVDPRVLSFESDPLDNHGSDTDTLVPAPDLETRKLRLTPDAEVIAGLPIAWRIEVDNHGVSDALGAQLIDDVPLFPAVTAGLADGTDAWSCSANAPLAPGGTLATAVEPAIADLSALVPTPDGQRWFGVSRSGSALVQVELDGSGQIQGVTRWLDGDSMGASTISGLAGASHLAVSPDGGQLYVSAAGSDSLLVFRIEPTGLSFLEKFTSGQDGVAGLRGAAYVAVSADGRFVYVAAVPTTVSASAIALFQRDPQTGQLQFVERIQDGLGTFGVDSNVIRGVKRLHLTADGRQLYAISTISQTLARFDVDPASGKLTYRSVLRGATGNGGTVLAELAGVRDLIATPGDTQLYVLADQGIALFERALNGELTLVTSWPAAGSSAARALAIDTWGSRVYLADADGSVHLYARQWSDGALEYRFSSPSPAIGDTGALLHLPVGGELLLAQTGLDGGLVRVVEQAISRCLTSAGTHADLPVPIDLGVGGDSQIDYGATVHPSARGLLRNVAHADPAAGGIDPNPANDEGIDEVQILVQSDLSIAKTGPVNAVAGEYITYVITVQNAGPSDALGIHVRDDLDPTRFQDASWTCAASGNSHCTSPTGTGAVLDAEADLLVGDTITVTLNVKVHPAWLGALQNAAYVVPEPGSVDPTPGDQIATPVDTEVSRHADLVVAKTTTTPEVIAGTAVAYTITVHNQGPSDAPAVQVTDALAGSLRDASWTCTAQLGVGNCGSASGQGSIYQTASIPVGETLRYELTANVSPAATGLLTNTATASLVADPQGEVLDPDPDNNSASVVDPILTRADLTLAATAPDAYDPASTVPMPYRVEVSNLGPSNAEAGSVVIQFGHAVRHTNVNCTPLQGTQLVCAIQPMAVGGSVALDFGLRELPDAPAILTGNVAISSATTDPVAANNSASTSTQMRTGVDLAVTIDDGHSGLAPGDPTRYTIRVRNVGSVDAVDARVLVPLATELLDASWQCVAPPGAYCSASGIDGIDDLINLPAGAALVYTLDATLDPAIDVLVQDFYVQTAEAQVDAAQVEVSTQNNTDSDTNTIYKVIYRDGFEGSDPVVPRPDVPLGFLWAPGARIHVIPMPDAALSPPPARASVRRPPIDTGGRA